MRVLQRAGMAAGTAALTLGLLPAVAGDGSPGLGSIGVAQASSVTVTPSSVGANATTTVRISGSGFSPEDDVAITNCPETNPGAVYPVPFPNPGPGRNAGRVVFIDSRTVLVSTPSVIPEGVCDIRIGGVTVPDALAFVEAPPRLDIEIRNTSGRPDSDVWVSVAYNCPTSAPSPPWPPGVAGCDTDGRTNPDYAWPGGSGGDPRRFWYEVYAGGDPLPAFTGIRLTDLPAVSGRSGTYRLSVANIDSGVVYVSYGRAVNTGSRADGRAPSYLTSPTRFDVFELTFHGSGTSAGDPGAGRWTNRVYANITAVAGLGILMDMQGLDNSVDAQGPDPQRVGSGVSWTTGLGIYDVYRTLASAGADVTDPRLVVTSDGGPATAANFLRFVSPSTNEGAGYANLGSGPDSYLSWLERQGRPMTVVGLYTGAGQGSGTWFCYRAARFRADAATVLRGTFGHASRDAAAAAAENACAGGTPGLDITTATSPTSGVPGPVTSRAVYMQDNAFLQGGAIAAGNDLYNAVYRDFIVSFAYGYWGSLPGDAGWVTTSWDRGQAKAFSSAWPITPTIAAHPRWNAYAESIWRVGNAYGMPYSDTFDNAGKGNPLVSGTSIHTLRVTLQPDGAWSDRALLLPTKQQVTARKGERFRTARLSSTGLTGPVVYSVSPRLPTSRKRARDGIWFSRAHGSILGSPTKLARRTTYVVTGTDSTGSTATARIRLRVVR
ncbi:MAG: hypothetical protein ACO3V1_03910 [Candidatus Nanopelagicales bacterium]